MGKNLKRKKQLRNALRRSGAIASPVTKIVEGTKKVVKRAEQSADQAGKVASKTVKKAVAATKEHVQKTTGSVEELAAKLEGLPLDRVKTFYEEGIQSFADFKNWTEKELLALKGIGPATIKKLQELGVKFK
ncbi:helix-hairpin-helix domain-containing protein [Streptococcus sp. DD13]|uniref:helix-hairpin-helix domain-containing protein n=1 Tax=Streptococcus sp. DD13 TaxID=1777881 RepID=UPI00079A7435|nr:helix-hairpin-helix domain-containing protein [Streptococcus sp. DD13]KXT79352.1 hypothetical protein STRDD13_00009 [Streptococcus sp. DD13]